MTDPTPSRARGLVPYALEVVAVLVLFAAVGAGCGWLWFELWDQPVGTVAGRRWFTDEEGLRNVFGGTAWYVVIAAVAGLVAGAVAAGFGRRWPLLTLGAVIAGSALAAWLMHLVGLQLSPPDPETVARTADDGTKLRGRLSLEGEVSPYLAWPMGSLVGLMVVNFALSSHADVKHRETHDDRWLSRNQPG